MICARFQRNSVLRRHWLCPLIVLFLIPMVSNAQKHPSRLFVEGHLGMKLIYGAGVGYTFIAGNDLSIRVLTGPKVWDGQDADITIGSLQWRGTFLPSASVSPFLEIGYGFASLFAAPYFNGHGFQTSAGIRWWFATHFDMSVRAVFARTWYHQRERPSNAKPSFTDDRAWGILSIGFAPGL